MKSTQVSIFQDHVMVAVVLFSNLYKRERKIKGTSLAKRIPSFALHKINFTELSGVDKTVGDHFCGNKQ